MCENKQLILSKGEHFLEKHEIIYWNERKEKDQMRYIAQLEATNAQLKEEKIRLMRKRNQLIAKLEYSKQRYNDLLLFAENELKMSREELRKYLDI